LAGISFSLVTDKLWQRSTPANQIMRVTLRRGAEILGLGLLFRLQEYALGFPWSPWTDLLRVDVLNVIGVSMMLMALTCWIVLRQSGGKRVHAGLILGASLVALSIGFVRLTERGKRHPGLTLMLFGFSGLALIQAARWLDALPVRIYPVYDFWHTSPAFFLIRLGVLLAVLFGAYAWCRWGLGQWRFSPLIQLGQTSLLVYWIHIEFVYGRFSILKKHGMSIRGASIGLLIIFLSMLLVAIVRTRWKSRRAGAPLPARQAVASN